MRIEDARNAVRIFDGVVESGDVRGSSHLFHLLVGDRLANARDMATERLAIAVVLHAALAQGISSTCGVLFYLFARHERKLVDLTGDEPMILVVAVIFF